MSRGYPRTRRGARRQPRVSDRAPATATEHLTLSYDQEGRRKSRHTRREYGTLTALRTHAGERTTQGGMVLKS
jgi:hypothetical protein